MKLATAGALVVAIGIGLGAFGAHGLKAYLVGDGMRWWSTAVEYQMWHGLALFALGLSKGECPRPKWYGRAIRLMIFGLILFSGTLYIMALTGERTLGAVVPIGGLSLIGAWLALAWAFTGTQVAE